MLNVETRAAGQNLATYHEQVATLGVYQHKFHPATLFRIGAVLVGPVRVDIPKGGGRHFPSPRLLVIPNCAAFADLLHSSLVARSSSPVARCSSQTPTLLSLLLARWSLKLLLQILQLQS